MQAKQGHPVPARRGTVLHFIDGTMEKESRLGSLRLAGREVLRERFRFVSAVSAGYGRGAWRGSRSFVEKNVCRPRCGCATAMPRRGSRGHESAQPRLRVLFLALRTLAAERKAYAQGPWRVRSLPLPFPRPSAAGPRWYGRTRRHNFRCCPFGVGANGTTIRCFVGSIRTHHYSLHYRQCRM